MNTKNKNMYACAEYQVDNMTVNLLLFINLMAERKKLLLWWEVIFHLRG